MAKRQKIENTDSFRGSSTGNRLRSSFQKHRDGDECSESGVESRSFDDDSLNGEENAIVEEIRRS